MDLTGILEALDLSPNLALLHSFDFPVVVLAACESVKEFATSTSRGRAVKMVTLRCDQNGVAKKCPVYSNACEEQRTLCNLYR